MFESSGDDNNNTPWFYTLYFVAGGRFVELRKNKRRSNSLS